MRLTTEHFRTPGFDIQEPAKRTFEGKVIIEGVTTTDQLKIVGYIYWPGNGRLVLKNFFNEVLYDGRIKDIKGFGNALKRADKK